MRVLTANKTKLLRLVRAKGYDAPRNARFTKAFRSRTWWLEWMDDLGSWQATLSIAAGRAFLGMRYRVDLDGPEKWTAHTLSRSELEEFELLEEARVRPISGPER